MARIRLGNLKGPKGDKGERGHKGDPFTFEDFTQEQLEKLKWPKGGALRFEDLTPEQKAELKGPKGDALRFEDLTAEQKAELKGEKSVATKAQQKLLNLNRWCKSNDVDDVLCAIIEQTVSAKIGFKPLTVGAALLRQTEVLVNGEPHYKVKVVTTDTEFEIQDNGEATITIPELGEDNVALEYYNFAGEKVADNFVPGAVTMQADEVYNNTVGVKFLRFGRKLVLKLNAYNETSFNWLGKWSKSEIDTLEMEADTRKFVKDLDRSTRNKYDGLTFIIGKPDNIRLAVDYPQGTVVINTPTSTQAINIDNNDIGWNGRQYEQYGL